jgi:hypothetical protein
MLRLDESIAHVAQYVARSIAVKYLNGGTDERLYGDLGRQEAKVLSLVYSAPEDSIAEELDRDIRRRVPVEIKRLNNSSSKYNG